MVSTALKNPFAYARADLEQLAQDVIGHARNLGASGSAVDVNEGSGLSVNVRHGKVETIEQNRDKGVGVTVYLGEGRAIRRGNASTSDFSPKALRETVEAAFNIARFTAADDAAGLPEEHQLERHPKDFDLYYPWDLTAEEAVKIGKEAEAAAFAAGPFIRISDGAGVSVQHGQFVSANSRGFMGGYPYSRHSISVAPIASLTKRGSDGMQRDDWYVSMRDARDLPAPATIGRYAAERAMARLGARQLSTRRARVLFEAPLAHGLLGAFTQAVSGGSLYRKSSFLLDSLGQSAFPGHVDIVDDPHVMKAMGSASFDEDGVKTKRRKVVEGGVVKGYFLSTYSARKLGMETTGNAGGSHNLTMTSRRTKSTDDFKAMLKKLDTGLLVTDLMGQGVNYVTGDYSRGASGFWVENGEIAYPVEEITIAGSMNEMFKSIEAIGADRLVRGNKDVGSILISDMMLAGT